MTVEIRELVIQATVSMPDETATPVQSGGNARQRIEEERWVQAVVQRVLEKLREEGWGPR